jgi:hypothetical protein
MIGMVGFGNQCRIDRECDDRRWPSAYQINDKRWQSLGMAIRGAVLDRQVAAL